MKLLLFLLVLTLPATAFAQATYDLSCHNVAKIRIVRVKAAGWQIDSPDGFFHALSLELKPEAAKGFGILIKTAPLVRLPHKGSNLLKEDITITASGKPLRNDDPAMTGLSEDTVTIPMIREQDAFEAARSVCPALVPSKVLLDGQWE